MDAFPRSELARLINRSRLPGVDPTEVRVLREWIRREGHRYDELRFNVRVGEGVELQGDYTEKFKADWQQRTRMRLDCVGYNAPRSSTLVEAKVQWTNDAVWQLLSYRDRYRVEFPVHEIALVGVCEAYTPSARLLASDHDIRLFVYGFPGDLPQAAAETAETS
jgi:hypothetical protein